MMASDFQLRLRKLNPKLKIYCGDDDSKPAGIFIIRRGEHGDDLGGSYDQLCSIDKNWVPEHTEFAKNGSIIKGGWRRALKILIQKGLVDRRKAERLFRTDLKYKQGKAVRPNPLADHQKKLAEYAHEIESWVAKRG